MMTKEQLISKTGHSLRMKDLGEFVLENEDISDEVPIIVERVKGLYFQGRPWHNGSMING